jgi:hypothetical protein
MCFAINLSDQQFWRPRQFAWNQQDTNDKGIRIMINENGAMIVEAARGQILEDDETMSGGRVLAGQDS